MKILKILIVSIISVICLFVIKTCISDANKKKIVALEIKKKNIEKLENKSLLETYMERKGLYDTPDIVNIHDEVFKLNDVLDARELICENAVIEINSDEGQTVEIIAENFKVNNCKIISKTWLRNRDTVGRVADAANLKITALKLSSTNPGEKVTLEVELNGENPVEAKRENCELMYQPMFNRPYEYNYENILRKIETDEYRRETFTWPGKGGNLTVRAVETVDVEIKTQLNTGKFLNSYFYLTKTPKFTKECDDLGEFCEVNCNRVEFELNPKPVGDIQNSDVSGNEPETETTRILTPEELYGSEVEYVKGLQSRYKSYPKKGKFCRSTSIKVNDQKCE